MFLLQSHETVYLLNFLIDELHTAGVKFKFADPMDARYRHGMSWHSDTDPVRLVSEIVCHASDTGSLVVIAGVSHGDESRPDAFFLDYSLTEY